MAEYADQNKERTMIPVWGTFLFGTSVLGLSATFQTGGMMIDVDSLRSLFLKKGLLITGLCGVGGYYTTGYFSEIL